MKYFNSNLVAEFIINKTLEINSNKNYLGINNFMKIYYGKAVYDSKEINASISVLKNKSLSLIDGPSVKKLESKIAKTFGKKFGLMVNSGSSANLF